MNYYNEIKNELINNEINKRVKDYSKNRSDLQTYYNIGKLLSEAGKHYGEGIIKKYSIKLVNEFGRKYNETTLKRMRQFYWKVEKGATVWHQLSWSHYKLLISLETIEEINYYSKVAVDRLSSVRKLESIIKSIDKSLDNLYKYNEQVVTEGLKDIYKEMDKQASIDLEASFNTINDRLIEEVIRTNWSGLSFSDRIWEHRRKLALTLKEELNRGLIRGDSLQDISRVIADKLNNSYSNAMRLVRTESCYVMNEATVNNYKENGIKEYEFMAFLDSKTSKVCRKLDGKKFFTTTVL